MDAERMENGSIICQKFVNVRSRGVFYGDNPFTYATPALMYQMSVSSLLISILQFFLTPLGQSAFVPQSIGGLLLGASLTGKTNWFRRMFFSKKNSYINETVSLFGCMMFLFLVGVKTDLSIWRRSGRKAIVIGVSAFFVPLLGNHFFAWVLSRYLSMDLALQRSLLMASGLQAISSYHTIACLLADLKLLNSELGRLAVSSSMVSGMCSWIYMVLVFTANQKMESGLAQLWKSLCVIGMFILVIYILRPIIFVVIKRTGRRRTIKEGYIVAIFVMLLGCSFLGELVGQHFLFGPMLLGLAIPDGPPLGSALVDKLDSYVACILLPIYFVVSSTRINMSSIELKNFGIMELVAFISFIWKLVGTFLPAICSHIPVLDAFLLGLVMNVQGIMDVQIMRRAFELSLVDEQLYSIMVTTMILTAAVITPVVKMLYKPSRRYRTHKKRTIQHSRLDSEFRMVGCIHHQDNTPSIINLLDHSNPNPKSPICFYMIHLIELSGRSSSLLVAHDPDKRRSSHAAESDPIINAFRLYEEQSDGNVIVSPFTAIAPYATMHDDVCEIALHRRASLVIIPFHKQLKMGDVEDEPAAKAVQAVNRNILRKAPCSVGILLDHNASQLLPSAGNSYSIAVIFLGGQDDREALAYAARMAGHPDVSVTLVQFVESGKKSRSLDEPKRHMDVELIKEFIRTNVGSSRPHEYKKEVVADSVAMVTAIQELEKRYDLILVGRQHSSESRLLRGFTEWNDFPELGVVGDMLASSDSSCKASVLVVQQQASAGESMVESPKFLMKGSFSVVDIPSSKHSAGSRVWPA